MREEVMLAAVTLGYSAFHLGCVMDKSVKFEHYLDTNLLRVRRRGFRATRSECNFGPCIMTTRVSSRTAVARESVNSFDYYFARCYLSTNLSDRALQKIFSRAL